MILKCGLVTADVPTVNNRIYPYELLKEMVEKYNNKKNNFGKIAYNYNANLNLNIEDISHKINKLYLIDGIMSADIDILDTPHGKILKEIPRKEILLKLFPTFTVKLEGNIVKSGEISRLDITV